MLAEGPATTRPGHAVPDTAARYEAWDGAPRVPADDGAPAGVADGIVRGAGEAVAQGVPPRGKGTASRTDGVGGRIRLVSVGLPSVGAGP